MLTFAWDSGNVKHIALHGVLPAEVEYVLQHSTLVLGYEDGYEEER